MKTLYPHQNAAVDAVFDYLRERRGYAPLVVSPVGSGKSLIHAEIIRRIHGMSPRTRIVSLAHVKELLSQNADELRWHYLDADFGFFCSGLGQKRTHNDITFASIQSIHNKAHLLNRPPQVILIDEAHLVPHNEETTYRRFIDDCLKMNPNLVVIGLTGSPFRPDSGRLDEGSNRLFSGVAYEIGIGWMIEHGYLVKPKTPKTSVSMDVSHVSVRKGDYVQGELEKAVDVDETTRACVQEILIHAIGRKKCLVFAAGIKHAEHIRDELRRNGQSADMVIGETDSLERSLIIRKYRNGEIKYLVNVATLTTGFNVPDTDMLVFMRPTKSPVLYIQMTGRGIRTVYADGFDLSTQDGRLDAILASSKPDCMLLDFGGVVDLLGPIDSLDIRKPPKKDGPKQERDAITKRCPACGVTCAPAQRYCYACGYSFVSHSLTTDSSKSAVVTADLAPEEHAVIEMEVEQHTRKGADKDEPKSMKVTYITLSGHYTEYVCFEHHRFEAGDNRRFAWDKAVKWHKDRNPDEKPPTSVEDALWMNYPTPSHVKVKRDGKYWRVIGCRFDEQTDIERPDLKLERERDEFERSLREQGVNPDGFVF